MKKQLQKKVQNVLPIMRRLTKQMNQLRKKRKGKWNKTWIWSQRMNVSKMQITTITSKNRSSYVLLSNDYIFVLDT